MKLLTHNFLSSRFLKDVQTGYPLGLTASTIEIKELELNLDFVKNMVPKLDYPVLKQAAKDIKEGTSLPDELPENWIENEDLVNELHRIIFCIEIVEGELTCPDTGRTFPIRAGIPNMLVSDDAKADRKK